MYEYPLVARNYYEKKRSVSGTVKFERQYIDNNEDLPTSNLGFVCH